MNFAILDKRPFPALYLKIVRRCLLHILLILKCMYSCKVEHCTTGVLLSAQMLLFLPGLHFFRIAYEWYVCTQVWRLVENLLDYGADGCEWSWLYLWNWQSYPWSVWTLHIFVGSHVILFMQSHFLEKKLHFR